MSINARSCRFQIRSHVSLQHNEGGAHPNKLRRRLPAHVINKLPGFWQLQTPCNQPKASSEPWRATWLKEGVDCVLKGTFDTNKEFFRLFSKENYFYQNLNCLLLDNNKS